MKRAGRWLIYIVGALSVGYLALYAYAMLTNRGPEPGDPIRIFRRKDAPSYSWFDQLSLPGATRQSISGVST